MNERMNGFFFRPLIVQKESCVRFKDHSRQVTSPDTPGPMSQTTALHSLTDHGPQSGLNCEFLPSSNVTLSQYESHLSPFLQT